MLDIPKLPNQQVPLVEDKSTVADRLWYRYFVNMTKWMNRFIVPPVSTAASIASPLTPDSTTFVEYCATAQAGDLTIAADSASPSDGQYLTFRLKDDGTPRNLTWTTGTAKSYRVIGTVLPTVTVASKTVYIQCVFNAAANRWDVILVAQEV